MARRILLLPWLPLTSALCFRKSEQIKMVSLSFPLRQSSLLKYSLGINSVLIVYVLLRSIQLIYTLVEQAENPSRDGRDGRDGEMRDGIEPR